MAKKNIHTTPKVYFSDHFNVDRSMIEDYGAVDISLVADIPLFIDPFLIFESDKEEYKKLHESIIDYLKFLKKMAPLAHDNTAMQKAWFRFGEVEQNWLGFSKNSNKGAGLGERFARSLSGGLGKILDSIDDKGLARGVHLEKLCIIEEGVGRDRISDFTVNLIKGYLAEYTEKFAKLYVDNKLVKEVSVERAFFNYGTRRWMPKKYKLPYISSYNSYVLLTPADILTKDDTWISSASFYSELPNLPNAVENEELRLAVNNYINSLMPDDPVASDKKEVYLRTAKKFPELVDVYIRRQEDSGEQAVRQSLSRVQYAKDIFTGNAKDAINRLFRETNFYTDTPQPQSSFEEAIRRVHILKSFIEDNDGYKCFFDRKGIRIHNEDELQRLFKLIWVANKSHYDVNPETNHGRGPVDFVVSFGSEDKTYVEFKLASNTKLRNNLSKQVEIYQKADIASLDTKSLKVILFFDEDEYRRVNMILEELGIKNSNGIIIIDGSYNNKPSGSKA